MAQAPMTDRTSTKGSCDRHSDHDWDIFRIGGKKAQRLGYVTAADAAQAVKRAIDEFNIPYADRLRIMAQRNDSYSV